MLVALHDRTTKWLSFDKAVAMEIVKVTGAATTATVTFPHVRVGQSYAIQVVHDANGNGKLDMRWFPFPKPREGAGVSNNDMGSMGPPSFDKALFPVAADPAALTIRMRY